jgi:hypothetical protein
MLVPFGFLIGTVCTGLVGAGCDDVFGTSGTGDVPFSRDLMQDRNAFVASRLPAILTDHFGSLPWKLIVIASEEEKLSSQSFSTSDVMNP